MILIRGLDMAIRLNTRMDNNNQEVYWSFKDEEDKETTDLMSLLESKGITNPDCTGSTVTVKYYRGQRVICTMMYKVTIIPHLNQMSYNGFIIVLLTSYYKAMKKMDECHKKFAQTCESEVKFIKNYVVRQRSPSPSDEELIDGCPCEC